MSQVGADVERGACLHADHDDHPGRTCRGCGKLPDLEGRCCAALTRARLEDHTDIDTFDRVLKSVMRLVTDERAAARDGR